MPGDVDRLELHLKGPLLDEFMRSRQLYAELFALASEIKTGYRTRVPKDTRALAESARVTMHRSSTYRDRRWEAEFTAGNSKVDYADDIERRDHPLGETLRDLGYGDVRI
jgi:hypothetical protein